MYGIYEVQYDKTRETLAEEKLDVIKNEPHAFWKFNTKEQAQIKISDVRFADRESRKYSRYTNRNIIHHFFIHECDNAGKIVLTQKEEKLLSNSK